MIKGIAVSEGISIAKVYKIEQLNLKIKKKINNNIEEEIKRFNDSIQHSITEIGKIRDIAFTKFGKDKAEIFEAHLLVINDPELRNQVEMLIREDFNAEYALLKIRNNFIELFKSMKDNAYMQERSIDIKDVTNRALAYLTNQKFPDLLNINEEVIIICNDLTPSESALLNNKYVKGIVTNIGGKTSHSAIITRSLQIPCVVGTKTITKKCVESDLVIVDAIKGLVYINPTNDEIEDYKEQQSGYFKHLEKINYFKDKPSLTKDNYKIKICANIASVNELEEVLKSGAEGIGLFRTEFLYMQSNHLPTEEEQFNTYKKVLETVKGFVVIRTLDIGGDKEVKYLNLPKELNPYLGYRAIRLCLDRKDIFKTQIRALLRASVYGDLKIMFPMISLVEEFLEAKRFVNEVKHELINEGVQVKDIKLGMTVEVPSAAILADLFAKEVDFFSIGTNDLIQYNFAADRLNEKVSHFYQPLNPSVLRLIKHVIDSAHNEGKIVGMCGEAASDVNVIPLLIGFGLDEFSMSSSEIINCRFLISKLNKKRLEEHCDVALKCSTQEEVLGLSNDIIAQQ